MALQNRTVTNGSIRCCGRKAQLYKRKGQYVCFVCHYVYDLNGRNLGAFGSGRTMAQRHKEFEAEAQRIGRLLGRD